MPETTTQIRRGLFWFRRDLRLDDNPALAALADQVDELICLYVVDPDWFRPGHFGARPMGDHRWCFLRQSLLALDHALRQRGCGLRVEVGRCDAVLPSICASRQIDRLALNHQPGMAELATLEAVETACPRVAVTVGHGRTLFAPADLPFALERLPQHFTPFRQAVETLTVAAPVDAPAVLPPNPLAAWDHRVSADGVVVSAPWRGGEAPALAHLQHYLFETGHIEHYFDTRNALEGEHNFSRLSPWLAAGCLSPRRVVASLTDYETRVRANKSTAWLYVELLWREFFQWYMERHPGRRRRFSGVRGKRPLGCMYPERYQRWCAGDTGYPIVDACMRELNATGFMSNRGRQLAASCFVHELGLDWRYGAAYFQQQLIDYDAAVNWGNWQYLAGVGADPRGHRQFDLAAQAERHDPDGSFRRRWAPDARNAPVPDAVDAADWPILPDEPS